MGLAADIILAARLRAGLSQRELAARAGTSQSTLNRYERGRSEPGLATVQRLVTACDLELRVMLAPPDRSDEVLAQHALAATPDERLATLERWSSFLADARPAS
jgi:transcriptional regulator with XRE-family HTH domain